MSTQRQQLVDAITAHLEKIEFLGGNHYGNYSGHKSR